MTEALKKPNILVLCIDQWDVHMDLPESNMFPALQRLESKGVTLDRHYCTVPICTPSRATMWTGQHAKAVGMWDNTNFAWIPRGLDEEILTLGDMLRGEGYYTAFKGKWHLSELAHDESALEGYGFSDYQQWGDMFGEPLEGEVKDGTVAMHTVDWLEHKRPNDQPWLLIASMVNPHDVMYFYSDEVEKERAGAMKAKLTHAQKLGFFRDYDPPLPRNFSDDLSQQPLGVHNYKKVIESTYGAPPEGREDLWKNRRNYLLNCMRMVDRELTKVLDALDRLDLWENTVVIYTSDHGEMNGAHRLHQKGSVHYDEAVIVNMTAVVPRGPKGVRTKAVGSHLDLVPTLLDFAGVSEDARRKRYPQLRGRSLKAALLDPQNAGPRGSSDEPGDGALYVWDGLNMLDPHWNGSGALGELMDLPISPDGKLEKLKEVGSTHGAPDFSRRSYYRAVVDGRYKLVRWFSPREYEHPTSVEEFYRQSDVTLHDLDKDPGEMENIGNQDHPDYDEALVKRMLEKLSALIKRELGDDPCPFDLNLFGTQSVTYQSE